ncbi:MAG: hypothetical protein GXW85_03180 [Clostridia bacterium]|nr:hypothetical protein [Clostridia bacterium]
MSFKAELDVYRFIMDIETYVMESTQIPFTSKVMVDKNVMYDYLDKLRMRLPKEIKECKKILEKNLEARQNYEKIEDTAENVNEQPVIKENNLPQQINPELAEQVKLKEREAEQKLEELKLKEKEAAERLQKALQKEREVAQRLNELMLKEKEADFKLQEIESKEREVALQFQKTKLKEQEIAQKLMEIEEKEREVAEKLQAIKLKETNEKLYDEKLVEVERLKQETQLKCREMLDDAEREAQRIVLRAQKYSDHYVEQVVKNIEEQIKKQMKEVKQGREQIADAMRKLMYY